MADKKQLGVAADHCETEANRALDRALDFAKIGGGPASSTADFEKAGALFAAAEMIKARAKEK